MPKSTLQSHPLIDCQIQQRQILAMIGVQPFIQRTTQTQICQNLPAFSNLVNNSSLKNDTLSEFRISGSASQNPPKNDLQTNLQANLASSNPFTDQQITDNHKKTTDYQAISDMIAQQKSDLNASHIALQDVLQKNTPEEKQSDTQPHAQIVQEPMPPSITGFQIQAIAFRDWILLVDFAQLNPETVTIAEPIWQNLANKLQTPIHKIGLPILKTDSWEMVAWSFIGFICQFVAISTEDTQADLFEKSIKLAKLTPINPELISVLENKPYQNQWIKVPSLSEMIEQPQYKKDLWQQLHAP